MSKKHLWEYDHPYYCEEDGYYYSADTIDGWGSPLKYQTFAEFLEEWADVDNDMNLLFRWDWVRYSPDEYEAECYDELLDEEKNSDGNYSQFKLFLMLQRKGCKKVITITHMEDIDEPEVRNYLDLRWKHMELLWGGISLEAEQEKQEIPFFESLDELDKILEKANTKIEGR